MGFGGNWGWYRSTFALCSQFGGLIYKFGLAVDLLHTLLPVE
jgi:hypothetical protein